MPIHIDIVDKVMDSLPDNLRFSADGIVATENISSNTSWGPFEVHASSVDLSLSQVWTGIRVSGAEWVNFLVEKTVNRLSVGADNEDGNVRMVFSKRDLQVTVSTNEEVEMGTELKCTFATVDQVQNKAPPFTDSSVDSDQNNEKMSKTCKFCGINFSHQCTLDAHMTYYCSKRQNVPMESSTGTKVQKTWRTRQRNKPMNSQKTSASDLSSFCTKVITEESRGSSSKVALNARNGSELNQHLNSTQKCSVSQSNGINVHQNIPKVVADPEKFCNKAGNSSDSEPENGTTNALGFCAPCGLFFSSKELYNIHMQLDITNFQSSIAKCNSLVLAAPVFNNNGLQYVPIHPRTAVINTPVHVSQSGKCHTGDDHAASVPLDLSINNSSKSPTNHQTERVPLDVASRIAAAAGLAINNCNNILRTNKRPFLCQHCQTRFQLYSTFQAHQEFYCQGKRQQLEVSEKRCRTSSTNSCQNDFETVTSKTENDIEWKLCGQGFKCDGCGFIGQTQRGIRIHCKNQCFKRFHSKKSETKSDDVEVNNSPTHDSWGGSNNATVALDSPDPSDICLQDSPIKIESV